MRGHEDFGEGGDSEEEEEKRFLLVSSTPSPSSPLHHHHHHQQHHHQQQRRPSYDELDHLEKSFLADLIQGLYKESKFYAVSFIHYKGDGRVSLSPCLLLLSCGGPQSPGGPQSLGGCGGPQSLGHYIQNVWTLIHVIIFYLTFIFGEVYWLSKGDGDGNRPSFWIHLILFILTIILLWKGWRPSPDGSSLRLQGSSRLRSENVSSGTIRYTLRWGLLILLITIAIITCLDAITATIKDFQNLTTSLTAVSNQWADQWNAVSNQWAWAKLEELKNDLAILKEQASAWAAIDMSGGVSGSGWSGGRVVSTVPPGRDWSLGHPRFVRVCLKGYGWLKERVDLLALMALIIYVYLLLPIVFFDLLAVSISSGDDYLPLDAHYQSFSFPSMAKLILHHRYPSKSANPLRGAHPLRGAQSLRGGTSIEYDVSLIPLKHRFQFSIYRALGETLCRPETPPLIYYTGIKFHRLASSFQRRIYLHLQRDLHNNPTRATFELRYLGGLLQGNATLKGDTIQINQLRSQTDTQDYTVSDHQDIIVSNGDTDNHIATCRLCRFGTDKIAGECISLNSGSPDFIQGPLLLIYGDTNWTIHQTVVFGQCLKEELGARYAVIAMKPVSSLAALLRRLQCQSTSDKRPGSKHREEKGLFGLLGSGVSNVSVLCMGDGYIQASLSIQDPVIMVESLMLYEPTVNLQTTKKRDQIRVFINSIQNQKFYAQDPARREEFQHVLNLRRSESHWIQDDRQRSHEDISLSPLLFSTSLLTMISEHL